MIEMIIEWNTHIFSPDLQRYPFHPRAAYHPDLSQKSVNPLQDYLDHMEQEGIDRSVLVHPEPYGDDHRLILDCLSQEKERFRGTCLFYPQDANAPSKLTALVAQLPQIVALRFHAHRGKETYLNSFADVGVRNLWKKALELKLIIELHIGPNYALQIAEILDIYPESTVLIDHLAEPHMGNAVEYAHVLDLANFDKVYMKLSGLNHFAKDTPFYLSARPFTARVFEAFGPDRMVWGSGSHQIVDVHMNGFSTADKLKVKGGNLVKLLDFA
ncbi:TPA: amidohydrolase [Candidatus Poribacteria bacterium]|nr:amidohydrolase [Candidatus Poribacteria bacterium]HIB86763.1 amidohydrolase [Candidatus Poribacteria bacterium]HIN30223.1 amidohydrolase [Candidatus Poribacteria bacterium]HIO07067.1 amidohydrolase [Candidatus Poribacteria bacterium]